jgi:arylsulfatase A-like enzyme
MTPDVPPTAKRPNFIVVMTDQQRADHLGCYGNTVVKTPNLDAVAARGTRFERFFVANPICQPNRAALATGQMTSVNGCRQNGIPLSLDSTTYADVLAAAGYRTGLVGKAHFQNVSNIPAKPRQQQGLGAELEAPVNHARQTQRDGPAYRCEVRGAWANDPDRDFPSPYYGFEHVRLCIGHGDQVEGHYTRWLADKLAEGAGGASDPRGPEKALDNASPRPPQVWRTAVPEKLYPTTYVADMACDFLAEEDARPFLLVVSFPDPHHPFTPPGRYHDLYDPDEVELPASFNHPTGARTDLPEHVLQAYKVGDQDPNAYWPFHVDEDNLRRMIALNYGTITMIDDMVGRILAALAATGQAEETVICFMSDHGDYMGDHGTVLKHGLHSQGVIRVPFIWSDPQAQEAGVSNLQASAIDFAPTLLQRAGLKVPIGMQGRDVLAKDAADLPVLIEDSGISIYFDPDADTSIRTLVHQGWRMSVFEGSDLGELYDLNTDPHELGNLWSAPEAQSRKMQMFQHMMQRQIALRDKSLLATNQA